MRIVVVPLITTVIHTAMLMNQEIYVIHISFRVSFTITWLRDTHSDYCPLPNSSPVSEVDMYSVMVECPCSCITWWFMKDIQVDWNFVVRYNVTRHCDGYFIRLSVALPIRPKLLLEGFVSPWRQHAKVMNKTAALSSSAGATHTCCCVMLALDSSWCLGEVRCTAG